MVFLIEKVKNNNRTVKVFVLRGWKEQHVLQMLIIELHCNFMLTGWQACWQVISRRHLASVTKFWQGSNYVNARNGASNRTTHTFRVSSWEIVLHQQSDKVTSCKAVMLWFWSWLLIFIWNKYSLSPWHVVPYCCTNTNTVVVDLSSVWYLLLSVIHVANSTHHYGCMVSCKILSCFYLKNSLWAVLVMHDVAFL